MREVDRINNILPFFSPRVLLGFDYEFVSATTSGKVQLMS